MLGRGGALMKILHTQMWKFRDTDVLKHCWFWSLSYINPYDFLNTVINHLWDNCLPVIRPPSPHTYTHTTQCCPAFPVTP